MPRESCQEWPLLGARRVGKPAEAVDEEDPCFVGGRGRGWHGVRPGRASDAGEGIAGSPHGARHFWMLTRDSLKLVFSSSEGWLCVDLHLE